MRQPIQWATASTKGRSEAASGARLINLYAEALPRDSKSPVALYGTPGTAKFTLLPTRPVLALHVMDNSLYAVTPSALYVVSRYGAVTKLGSVALSGRVSVANNGASLVLVDGSKGYAYSSAGGLTQLSGDGWYPADTVTYQDGYFIFNRAGTGQFFLSELLATTFDALDFATAEAAPDDSLAVLSDHRELWIFGRHSIEVWYNSGDPDFPFERMQGAYVERGIAAPHSAAKMDNTVYWLGEDGIVYRAAGYQPKRVSTHAVEQAIDGEQWDAFAYTYTEEGHKFYVLTFPSQEQTWVYDAATNLWHERQHYEWGRHHGNCYAWAYDQHMIGDWQNGLIYQYDMSANDDEGDPIQRIAVSPPIHNRRNRLMVHSLELDMASGIGLSTGQGDDPQAMLQWSDDGGKTWSNDHWASIGRVGEYLTRVIWRRMGSFRQRQYRVTISDPIPVVILGAYAEIENGRS